LIKVKGSRNRGRVGRGTSEFAEFEANRRVVS
jgi:hypothetical protein